MVGFRLRSCGTDSRVANWCGRQGKLRCAHEGSMKPARHRWPSYLNCRWSLPICSNLWHSSMNQWAHHLGIARWRTGARSSCPARCMRWQEKRSREESQEQWQMLLLHEEWSVCLMIWSYTCPMYVFKDVCFRSNQSRYLLSLPSVLLDRQCTCYLPSQDHPWP